MDIVTYGFAGWFVFFVVALWIARANRGDQLNRTTVDWCVSRVVEPPQPHRGMPHRIVQSAVPGADPVQQIVHDLVLEAVADRTALPSGTHPALLTQYSQRLRYRVLRAAQHRGEVAHIDAGSAVQHEQNLQTVGV
jgi:hypothetical protein